MFTLGATSVVVPIVYFYVESSLPSLETAADIEARLRQSVEDERMSAQVGKLEHEDVSYKTPNLALLQRDQLALFISSSDCPSYFVGPKQSGFAWLKSLLLGLFGSSAGNGGCERLLAEEIGSAMGIRGKLPLAVAANKIHAVLQKDQLMSYALSSLHFDEGVIGMDAAADALFHSPSAKLSLSEMAELALALPTYGFFSELRNCQNPVLLRQNRDLLLHQATEEDLISTAKAKRAQLQPIACSLQR